MSGLSVKLQWPDEVQKRMKHEHIAIIDVREPYEYAEGHIPGAINIPLMEIPARISELSRINEQIIVCLSGARSSQACTYLAQKGFPVVNMYGGMLEWRGDLQSKYKVGGELNA